MNKIRLTIEYDGTNYIGWQWQPDGESLQKIVEEAIEQASKTDGIFPLITNATLPATEVLQIYKKQPFLEKRFYTKKSVLEVAPVFLKNNQRIEAMLFLYFIALMLVSLIERNIRRQMVEKEIESIPILPARIEEFSSTRSASAACPTASWMKTPASSGSSTHGMIPPSGWRACSSSAAVLPAFSARARASYFLNNS